MNFTPEQVELIVQRVVAHLDATRSSPAPATARPETSAPPALENGSPAAVDSLRIPPSPPRGRGAGGEGAATRSESSSYIAGPVITRDLLSESVRGAATIRVGSKALLTPSARDFVREHGIRIVRESTTPASSAPVRCQAIIVTPSPQIAAALDDLAGRLAVDRRLVGSPAEAATQATSALCRAEAALVVIFTSQPELVACLANRNDRIRGAPIADVASAERVLSQLNSNLLALDATHKSAYDLKSIMKTVTRHAPGKPGG